MNCSGRRCWNDKSFTFIWVNKRRCAAAKRFTSDEKSTADGTIQTLLVYRWFERAEKKFKFTISHFKCPIKHFHPHRDAQTWKWVGDGEFWGGTQCLIRSIVVTQFGRSHPELTFETLGTNKWKGSVINLFNMRGSALVDDTHKPTNNELTDESLPELLGKMMMLVCDPVSINFPRIFLPTSLAHTL